ncbi:hypothetical protein Godav_021942 [Gossypium davidsonii]|uniref:non-specific serine/threonine protein kinase n=2 Tax=Gossypium TaxID=3633 RepID=A0A7J8T9K1_GOSDV|nr:hypothetical protein [Gossypium davidsonii]MBA0661584.1 hypothetical protein [Gossypium klotzschianum]
MVYWLVVADMVAASYSCLKYEKPIELLYLALWQDYVKRQTRFVSRKPPRDIISSVEAVAESMGLKVHTRNYKTRLERISANKVGEFAVVLEVFEVAPSLFMADVRKASGDTLEYHKFYKNFCTKLENIIWKPREDVANPSVLRSLTC